MNKKDKDLLIKDLSARVFYGVKVNIERDFPNNPQIVERIAKDGEIIVNGIIAYDIYYYKPYLRPMSNMTEEEFLEYHNIKYNKVTYRNNHKRIDVGKFHNVGIIPIEDYLDWLNEHHFDYRCLIEKGLALEAPEGMYKKS